MIRLGKAGLRCSAEQSYLRREPPPLGTSAASASTSDLRSLREATGMGARDRVPAYLLRATINFATSWS